MLGMLITLLSSVSVGVWLTISVFFGGLWGAEFVCSVAVLFLCSFPGDRVAEPSAGLDAFQSSRVVITSSLTAGFVSVLAVIPAVVRRNVNCFVSLPVPMIKC